MDFYQAILLGIVQGLTEFFPVSSSGHLVIMQSILPGFGYPGVLFEVVLHLGTLCAILLYFRKRLIGLTIKYWKLIVIGTIPAALIGVVFGDLVEALFSSTKVVGVSLLVTGAINFMTDKFSKEKGDPITKSKSPYLNTLYIGIFQSFALIPGISRSGSTIFAGVSKGLEKKEVAEFSFLLSVPAIIGAAFLQLIKYGDSVMDVNGYVAGFFSAMVAGYVAITWVIRLLQQERFRVFGYYCVALGLLVILLL